jgi:thioredoxin reductase
MAIDTPATIAVLGAGPIGLETALYARFLGYDVNVYERGVVAQHVLRWGHVRMFTPFAMNCSPLGLRALEAQNSQYKPPDPSAPLIGREWVRQYLLPLAQSDLLVDHLHEPVSVVSVSRQDLLKTERRDAPERSDGVLRILLRDRDGAERSEHADIVIDTTGVFGQPNWLGPGGAPALGEVALRDRIEYWLPDVEGAERARYAGQQVLVVGDGLSAATNVVALRGLALQAPDTRVIWVTHRPGPATAVGPIRPFLHDPLPSRRELASGANRYASEPDEVVTHRPGTLVEAVALDQERRQFVVRFSGAHAGEERFDRVIANVGYQPDASLYAELQVDCCEASGAPRRVGELVRATKPEEYHTLPPCPPQALVTTEPNFYILGAKSFGRDSRFVFVHGLDQIRAVFSIIGDREDLDLYQSVQKQHGSAVER